MKYIKTYELYTGSDTSTLMEEFIEWLSGKLGIKIGEYIGGGVEGSIYGIDKHRVIKLTYSNVTSEQYMSSRNIDGIVKIYQTGIIDAPKRFKYPKYAKPKDYEYTGIDLLSHDRTYGTYDTKMGYAIMERLYPSKELENKLKLLDGKLWYDGFIKGEWVDIELENGRFDRVYTLDDNDYHPETIKVIKKSQDSFGVRALKTLFEEYKNQHLINDYRKYIQTNHKEYLDIVDRLIIIAKNVGTLNMHWGDVHCQQFAYNSKGVITAFDISFGFVPAKKDEETGNWVDINPNKDKESAFKHKVKNVIRENIRKNKY